MAKRLNNLAQRMERIKKKLPKEVAKVSTGCAFVIIDRLANMTPVDTSLAVSNWQTSIGSKVSSEIPPHFPGIAGSTAPASRARTMQNTRTVLKGYKAGKGIWISNLVHYIRLLNDGSSNQAPAGFVQGSILLGHLFIKQAKLDLS